MSVLAGMFVQHESCRQSECCIGAFSLWLRAHLHSSLFVRLGYSSVGFASCVFASAGDALRAMSLFPSRPCAAVASTGSSAWLCVGLPGSLCHCCFAVWRWSLTYAVRWLSPAVCWTACIVFFAFSLFSFLCGAAACCTCTALCAVACCCCC